MKKISNYFGAFFILVIILMFTQMPAFSISIGKVVLLQEKIYSYIPAEVVSKTAVTISSKIPGFVKNLRVDIGDKVKKGEILLTIDQNVSRQNVKQALANVAKAKAQLKNAQFNFEKFSKLYKQKAVSRQQFLNMKTNYKTALGAYEQAVSALRNAQSMLKYSVIKSPIDGIISAKYVNNGDMASVFSPLLKISHLQALQVKADIDKQTLKYIQSLKFVKVKIKSITLTLKVSHIAPALDSITRTLEIKIDLPTKIEALPGEFAYVIIPSKTEKMIAVKKTAKTVRGGIEGVFVVNKSGRANFRMVRFGKVYNGYITVLSGLFPNEKVVLNPPLTLKNDSLVVNGKQQ